MSKKCVAVKLYAELLYAKDVNKEDLLVLSDCFSSYAEEWAVECLVTIKPCEKIERKGVVGGTYYDECLEEQGARELKHSLLNIKVPDWCRFKTLSVGLHLDGREE